MLHPSQAVRAAREIRIEALAPSGRPQSVAAPVAASRGISRASLHREVRSRRTHIEWLLLAAMVALAASCGIAAEAVEIATRAARPAPALVSPAHTPGSALAGVRVDGWNRYRP